MKLPHMGVANLLLGITCIHEERIIQLGLGVKGIIEMFEVLRSYKDCDCLRKALHYTKVNLIKSLSRVLGVCGWRDGGGLWKLSSCNTVACGE